MTISEGRAAARRIALRAELPKCLPDRLRAGRPFGKTVWIAVQEESSLVFRVHRRRFGCVFRENGS